MKRLLAILAGLLCLSGSAPALGQDGWSAAQLALLGSLQLNRLPKAPADRSNRYEDVPAAAALGKQLFFDRRLSANGQVACASCHDPARQFQDGRALAQGIGSGTRRSMPLAESGRGAWLFWDGRKDSLWSQALGPLEDAAEHGGNRLAAARLVSSQYKDAYEAVFGALPSLQGMPENAGPAGTEAERRAWLALGASERDALSRVFANLGKAIAAYEKTLHLAPGRFDAYLGATVRNDPQAAALLTAPEQRGLRLFIGKGECVTCHAGPLLTDHYFHNTGVAPRLAGQGEPGRSQAIARVLADEFNCLGTFSDAPPAACQELAFINRDDPRMAGAFKTPSLRQVGLRPPYMHAGQIATLEGVVRHYAAAPAALAGKSERRPLRLSEQEVRDLVSFLGAL
jgi:cytochrome c peroxidase